MIGLALRFALGRAWGWLSRNPLVLLCIGLGLWGVWEHHRASGWQHRAQACQMASDAARKAQDALRAQEAKDYHDKAAMADAKYAADLDRVRASVADYARSHRVQALRGGAPSGVSEAGASGVPEAVPADNVSTISDADLYACAAATAYAIRAHEWALTITEPTQ